MLVLEQPVGGLQRLVVIGGDDLGGCLGKYLESRLADDVVARHAELRLGHAVDQEIAAIMRILHGDLRGDVVDDLAQEGVIAVAFLFEVPPFGDVFDAWRPIRRAASGLLDGLNPTPVRALHDAAIDLALCDVLQEGGTKLLHVAAEGSAVLAVLDDVGKMAARLHDVGDRSNMSM